MPNTFNVNHVGMEKGLYLAGSTEMDSQEIYTIDVRLARPYEDKPIPTRGLHTLEHFLALALEEVCEDKEISKIYWGPMGCQTGFYLLLGGPHDTEPRDLAKILYEACMKCISDEDIPTPAATKEQCGNYVSLFKSSRHIQGMLKELSEMASKVVEDNEFSQYNFIE